MYNYTFLITFSLVADQIVFNSQYNFKSFMTAIESFLKTMPDYRPKGLLDMIGPKCQVIHFPLEVPENFICEKKAYNT